VAKPSTGHFCNYITVAAAGEKSRYGTEKATAASKISIQTNVHTRSLERQIHLSVCFTKNIYITLLVFLSE
jgi:hypothetical protein